MFSRHMRFAATPQYGTMIFRGRSGRTYVKDVYVSDVLVGLINIDGGSGAGTAAPTDWLPPEPVILEDFSVVTGLADTTKLQMTRDGVPTGDHLRYSIHLTTLANRPRLMIPFGARQKITAIQR